MCLVVFKSPGHPHGNGRGSQLVPARHRGNNGRECQLRASGAKITLPSLRPRLGQFPPFEDCGDCFAGGNNGYLPRALLRFAFCAFEIIVVVYFLTLTCAFPSDLPVSVGPAIALAKRILFLFLRGAGINVCFRGK